MISWTNTEGHKACIFLVRTYIGWFLAISAHIGDVYRWKILCCAYNYSDRDIGIYGRCGVFRLDDGLRHTDWMVECV